MAATKKTTPDVNEMFSTMFKMPTVDMNVALEAQRKNIEAVMEANRVAFEGYKGAVERQVSLMKSTMTDMNTAAGEAFSGKTPELNASKQMEAVQSFMTNAFANAQEVAELTTKANKDAFDVLQARFNDGVEEMKSAAK